MSSVHLMRSGSLDTHVLIKVFDRESDSMFHETASVKIEDINAEVFDFAVMQPGDNLLDHILPGSKRVKQKGEAPKTTEGVHSFHATSTVVAPFTFIEVDPQSTVFCVKGKIQFEDSVQSTQWFESSIHASDLLYEDSTRLFKGSLRNTPISGKQLTTRNQQLQTAGKGLILVFSYEAVKFPFGDEGRPMAIVHFSGFRIQQDENSLLKRAIERKGDKIILSIGESYLDRANQIVENGAYRTYSWKSKRSRGSNILHQRPPSDRDKKEKSADQKKVKRLLSPRSMTDRPRRNTIVEEDDPWIADGTGYVNLKRTLPVSVSLVGNPSIPFHIFNIPYKKGNTFVRYDVPCTNILKKIKTPARTPREEIDPALASLGIKSPRMLRSFNQVPNEAVKSANSLRSSSAKEDTEKKKRRSSLQLLSSPRKSSPKRKTKTRSFRVKRRSPRKLVAPVPALDLTKERLYDYHFNPTDKLQASFIFKQSGDMEIEILSFTLSGKYDSGAFDLPHTEPIY